ncbi:MAG TPA: hypothetical protein DCM40_18070 [Maribacter sp.]|nr:hypothetical protein [Maribacter sp.]
MNCESEYIIHYHADAFALDLKPIKQIIDAMKENNYDVAYRGKGIDYRNPKNICGDVDDHFLIFKRQALLDSKIFNVDYNALLRFLHVGNPETLLSKLINDSIDRDKIYHYSDMFENEQGSNTPDDFYKDNIMHRAMNPYNFDNGRNFLHFGNVDKSWIQENLASRGIDSSLIQI